jgi:hypothetical protein
LAFSLPQAAEAARRGSQSAARRLQANMNGPFEERLPGCGGRLDSRLKRHCNPRRSRPP